jgi:hypothetical protein
MPVCPKCSLDNPKSAVMCDCGYPFDDVGAYLARQAGFVPYGESHPRGPSGAVKLGVGILGYVAGRLPLEVRAFWVFDDSYSAVWAGTGIVAGFVGVAMALGLLRVVHEVQSKRGGGRLTRR